MNTFGMLDEYYTINEYVYAGELHIQEETNQLLFIASNPERPSVRNLILSMNLETGEVTKVVDLYELFSDEFVDCDFEIESFDCMQDGSMIVNLKDYKSMIVFDVHAQVNQVNYILTSNEDLWEATSFQGKIYQKIGNFEHFSNPYEIQVLYGEHRLVEGQYYITMLNRTEEQSVFYKMFIDENTKTYTLAEQVELDGLQHGHWYEDAIDSINQEVDTDQEWIGIYKNQNELIMKYQLEEENKISKIAKINEFWW